MNTKLILTLLLNEGFSVEFGLNEDFINYVDREKFYFFLNFHRNNIEVCPGRDVDSDNISFDIVWDVLSFIEKFSFLSNFTIKIPFVEFFDTDPHEKLVSLGYSYVDDTYIKTIP